MELYISNISGRVKRVTVNGREFLIAPLSLIVPGVLNGSRGALYYPPEEIERDYQAWNGMPIVVNHPVTDTGDNISARTPSVMKNFEIGRVYNARIGDDGSLLAEGWFDVSDTRRVDERIYNWLRRGKKIELSTGLFTQNHPAENGATHNGRSYAYVARNLKPDHLAILPDQKGACSLDDGCGVLANADKCPKCGEVHMWTRNSNPEGCNQYKGCGAGGGDAGGDTAKFSSGNHKAVSITKGVGGKKNRVDVKYEAEIGLDAASAIASKIGAKKFGRSSINGTKGIWYDMPTTNSDATLNGDDDMKLTAEQRKGHVTFLTTNCDCWKGKDDAKTLNELSDEKLVALRKAADDLKKANATLAVFNTGIELPAGITLVVNAEGKPMMKDKDGEECSVDNKEECEKMMAKGAKKEPPAPSAKGKKPYTKNADTTDDTSTTSTTTTQDKAMDPEAIALAVQNYLTGLTPSQKLKLLGPEMESAVTNAVKVEKRTKAGIITRLTANIKDTKSREALVKRLSSKSLDELEDLMLLAPANGGQTRNADDDDVDNPNDLTNYMGANGGYTQNRVKDIDDSELLPIYNTDSDEDE